MLIDIQDLPVEHLERLGPGLYVPLTWQGAEFFEYNPDWYGGDYAWPELQGEDRLHWFVEWGKTGQSFYGYGVCDSPYQFLCSNDGKNVVNSPWPLVVTFRKCQKSDPATNAWRWHKQGPYIGTQFREGYEYFKDEPNIEVVYFFSVYRRKNSQVSPTSP